MNRQSICPVCSPVGSLAWILRSTTAFTTGGIAMSLGLMAMLSEASANPEGGVVQAGEAEIVTVSPNRLNIVQGSDRAIINWDRFSIEQNEHTHFEQPSASASTLNRVVGRDLSTIAGQLTATGKVFLINPNGVLFTETSRVDVSGLVASTSAIEDRDFMAGRYQFRPGSNPDGFVINKGQISIKEGGLASLVAPWVENNGYIAARLGKVVMASGDTFTIDLNGDGLIQLALARATGDKPALISDEAAVDHSGIIEADGGMVLLTTGDAQGVVDQVINMDGVIQAETVAREGGKIVLGGNDAKVTVAGTLDASGKESGGEGGQVVVAGAEIRLVSTANINVSGDDGGGEVLIGGDYQGAPPLPVFKPAEFTKVAAGAAIEADAITTGNGGKIIAWADQATSFRGSASATGGAVSGDGGLIETSGKIGLDVQGAEIDASAANGKAGTWLLDPTDIVIRDVGVGEEFVVSADDALTDRPGNSEIQDTFFFPNQEFADQENVVDTADIEAALNGGTGVRVVTTSDDQEMAGNITVEDAVRKTYGGEAFLELFADNNINLNAPIVNATSSEEGTPGGALNVFMRAGNDISIQDQGNIDTEFAFLFAEGGAISQSALAPRLTTSALELLASNGIGNTEAALRTSGLARVEATTASGGIFINNTNSQSLQVTATGVANVIDPGTIAFIQSPGSETPITTPIFGQRDVPISEFSVADAASAGGEGIVLSTDGDLILSADVSTPDQSVSLTSGGLIASDPETVISGSIVGLSAATGILASTETSAVDLENTDSGSVVLSNEGDLDLINLNQVAGGNVILETTGAFTATGSPLAINPLGSISIDAGSIVIAPPAESLQTAAALVDLTAETGIDATVATNDLTVANTASGDVTINNQLAGTLDLSQSGGGDVAVVGADDLTIDSLEAPGSTVTVESDANLLVTAPLGSPDSLMGDVTITAAGQLALLGIQSNGDQSIRSTGGEIVLDGTYITTGNSFVANGPTRLVNGLDQPVVVDTTSEVAGINGDITFNDTLDGTTANGEDLTLRVGDGTVDFGTAVGGAVPLGVVRVEGTGDVVATAVDVADVIGDEDTTFGLIVGDPDVVAGTTAVLILRGLLPGTIISDGSEANSITVQDAAEAVDITGFDLPTLTITPPENSDELQNVTAELTLTADGTAVQAEIIQPTVFNVAELITDAVEDTAESGFTVTVTAVADAALLDPTNVQVLAGQPVAIDLGAALVDDDGSEALTVVISDLPDSAVLSAGLVNEDGSVTLDQTELQGLTLTVNNAADLQEPLQLTITAVTTEGANQDFATISEPLLVEQIGLDDEGGSAEQGTGKDVPGIGVAIDRGRPFRIRDLTPLVTSLARDEGDEENAEDEFALLSEEGDAVRPDIWEACPDVVEASVSWQNTAADAAFNIDPDLIPYSVDVYCGGYQVTAPGRGTSEAYQGLSFVTRDFWTDLLEAQAILGDLFNPTAGSTQDGGGQ